MGVIVNSTEPMSRMRVVTSKDRSAQTLKLLQRAGILHAEESTELHPIDREAIEKERRQVSELLASIDDALKYIKEDRVLRIKEDVDVYLTKPLADVDKDTRALCTKLGAMHQHAQKLQEEQEALEELRDVIAALAPRTDLTTADLDFTGTHLLSRLAAVPQEIFQAVGHQLEPLTLRHEVVDRADHAYVFFVARAESQVAIESWVEDNGGRFVAAPKESIPLKDFVGHADKEAARLQSEAAKIRADIEKQTDENLEMLVLLREALLAENERLEVLEKACEAKYVTLFEGWVPRNGVESVTGDLREQIGYVYIESRDVRPDEEPPSKLRNAKALRPFETVVNLFGTPKYREWDPTPIIAYSFAFFFGVMLGDAVYGIFLILLTKFMLPKLVDDPNTDGFALFRLVLYISAGASIVMGVLTGTYLGDFFPRFFGAPDLALAPAVQEVYMDTMTFIVVSLGIGLIHVNIGHALMLIRGFKEKQKHLVIGRLGLFILQIAGIPWILNFIGFEVLPLAESTYSILLYIMGGSVVLIIIASILEKGSFLGSIFWIFDITGILGDVMSYARLAGVGLATYFLAYCFNMMSVLIAEMIPAGVLRIVLGTIIMLFILLFGHILNLVLSSITCFVHSLRLCFVEFLFKFYEGGGRQYSPLRLRRRALIEVKAKA